MLTERRRGLKFVEGCGRDLLLATFMQGMDMGLDHTTGRTAKKAWHHDADLVHAFKICDTQYIHSFRKMAAVHKTPLTAIYRAPTAAVFHGRALSRLRNLLRKDPDCSPLFTLCAPTYDLAKLPFPSHHIDEAELAGLRAGCRLMAASKPVLS